jgi:beta-xylosidase
MFLSKSNGYYHSKDLVNWVFVKAQAPLSDTIEAYAPTAIMINETVFFLASTDTRLYKTTNPADGASWTVAQSNFLQYRTDPCLFQDDDGRVYYYGGSSDSTPIVGVEINSRTWTQIGQLKNLIYAHHDVLGWERKGDYNTDNTGPSWVEGAWMNKIGKTYYLQYANPGATLKCCNDAVYTSDNRLGPFTVANHSPFSYRPEGFVGGAGHGSTFYDFYGNIWHVGTQAISIRDTMERRLGLYPVFHDEDGTFWTYTGYGDWPIRILTKRSPHRRTSQQIGISSPTGSR